MNNKYALPNDIEENILSRLPVKTILRFMSVCKSWYSLFLNPYFINLHIQNYSNNNNLLLMNLRKKKGTLVINPSSSAVHSRLSHISPQLMVNEIHDYQRSIVGSCNGIVCLHFFRFVSDNDRTFEEHYCLWNPAMRIIKDVLKRVDYIGMGSRKRLLVGFGFHSRSNDCKVVRFQNFYVGLHVQVDIYSLSSDSWKTVNVAPPSHIRRFFSIGTHTYASVGVFVNGVHHWVYKFRNNKKERSSAIFSFDMEEEVFKEIVIPKECMRSQIILFNKNESLAMLTFGVNMGPFAYFWVMKDYGLPESWTKICAIDTPRLLVMGTFWRFIQTKNEVIISSGTESERLIVFDTDKSEVKDTSSSIANTELVKDAIQVKPYKESLLLLKATNIIHY